MIVKSVCKKIIDKGLELSYIGLDEHGSLWMSTDSEPLNKEWKPIDFNTIYKNFYPVCKFTAIGATEQDFVAAGTGEDGLPYVFRSLLGGVWESVNLLCGNSLIGYQRASGMIVDIIYDQKIKQLFMICENGELLTIPDCPKCAKLYRVSDEKITSGRFSKDNSDILITTSSGKELAIEWESAVQIRVSPDYARQKIKEGGILVDLRETDLDDIDEVLDTQHKESFIAFLCNYGVQADQAAKYARRKGYHQSYSLGGVRFFDTSAKEPFSIDIAF
ncbi:rhodanese-like domain-containing protein [Clostridium sp. AF19-22AC]|uniref:rhodanese-like domain-containing protein n=1 Tax=Clostridia TaxID=186801 RepID=UPI000E4EAB30|nr:MULTISPECIES: rhodanese-like domain-containing protein [Clostridia]RHR22565.1 rhodanese-like domain-containing protein [Clostridium sp. AF19-22AC]